MTKAILDKNPITSVKVRFPKKGRKIRKRYKAIKKKETTISKALKITEKSLIAAGVTREGFYSALDLDALLINGGSVHKITTKIPKEYVLQEYKAGLRTFKKRVSRYSGNDIYDFVILRDAGKTRKTQYANYNDNTNKLPATLYINPKKRNRKARKVKCEHCGCVIPKNMRKPKKLSYTEMLRESGKFSGVLTMRRLRQDVLRGRRSYVRDKE